MEFETALGITLAIFIVLLFRSYAKGALEEYRMRKAEEEDYKEKSHPIITSAIGGLIAWKALEIFNRSQNESCKIESDVTDNGSESSTRGRSVFDDLKL